MAEKIAPTARRKALQQATCVAILAASLAAPMPTEAGQVIQSAGYASALAGGCALLKDSAIDAVRRYCHSSWRQAGIPGHDWDDCTQDVMIELLNRLSTSEIADSVEDPGSPHRRELMRSVWCVTQRWRRATKKQTVPLSQLADPIAKDTMWSDFDFEQLENAISSLSPTQQDILAKSRNGDSVAEIAAALKIPAARVSDQKYKAVRKLQGMMASA